MAKASYPDQIFLQLYGIDGEYEVDDDGNPTDLSEVTWSVGKVYDTDIRYVALRLRVERLEKAVEGK